MCYFFCCTKHVCFDCLPKFGGGGDINPPINSCNQCDYDYSPCNCTLNNCTCHDNDDNGNGNDNGDNGNGDNGNGNGDNGNGNDDNGNGNGDNGNGNDNGDNGNGNGENDNGDNGSGDNGDLPCDTCDCDTTPCECPSCPPQQEPLHIEAVIRQNIAWVSDYSRIEWHVVVPQDTDLTGLYSRVQVFISPSFDIILENNKVLPDINGIFAVDLVATSGARKYVSIFLGSTNPNITVSSAEGYRGFDIPVLHYTQLQLLTGVYQPNEARTRITTNAMLFELKLDISGDGTIPQRIRLAPGGIGANRLVRGAVLNNQHEYFIYSDRNETGRQIRVEILEAITNTANFYNFYSLPGESFVIVGERSYIELPCNECGKLDCDGDCDEELPCDECGKLDCDGDCDDDNGGGWTPPSVTIEGVRHILNAPITTGTARVIIGNQYSEVHANTFHVISATIHNGAGSPASISGGDINLPTGTIVSITAKVREGNSWRPMIINATTGGPHHIPVDGNRDSYFAGILNHANTTREIRRLTDFEKAVWVEVEQNLPNSFIASGARSMVTRVQFESTRIKIDYLTINTMTNIQGFVTAVFPTARRRYWNFNNLDNSMQWMIDFHNTVGATGMPNIANWSVVQHYIGRSFNNFAEAVAYSILNPNTVVCNPIRYSNLHNFVNNAQPPSRYALLNSVLGWYRQAVDLIFSTGTNAVNPAMFPFANWAEKRLAMPAARRISLDITAADTFILPYETQLIRLSVDGGMVFSGWNLDLPTTYTWYSGVRFLFRFIFPNDMGFRHLYDRISVTLSINGQEHVFVSRVGVSNFQFTTFDFFILGRYLMHDTEIKFVSITT